MAPSDRQERRRMRERGAGITRDLKSTNFAFTFGSAVVPAQRSSRKTPQPAAGHSASKQTPASTRSRTSRKTPTAAGDSKQSEPATQSAKSQSGRRASASAPRTGRRSIAKSIDGERSASGTTPGIRATPSVTGKRKRHGPSVPAEANEQDELEQEDAMEAITGRRSWGEQIPAPRRKQSLGAIAETAVGEDELELLDATHDLSHVGRISLGAAGLNLRADAIRTDAADGQTGAAASATPLPVATPVSHKAKGKALDARRDALEGAEKENETHSTFIRRMYKPRGPLQAADENPKSRRAPTAPMFETSAIEVEPPMREVAFDESSHLAEPLDLAIDPSLEDITADSSTAQPIGHSPTTALSLSHGTPLFLTPGVSLKRALGDEAEMSPVRGRKRRRSASESSGQDGEEPSQPVEAPPAENVKRLGPKRRKAQHGRAATSPGAMAGSDIQDGQSTAPQRATSSTVPITVYRLSKVRDHDDSDDELNANPATAPSARLPAVNPVDVLTQIATEMVDHMAETAHRLPSTSASRSSITSAGNRKADAAELKRKRAILHHFKQVLSDSLFDITAALDAGNAYASRLKTLTKEKIQLREELMTVRKQRDDVALKIDRVRREHAAWRERTTTRDELSADLWDIEVAVKSGREACSALRETDAEAEGPQMGIEMLAASVAELVGGASTGAGLCARVERLNNALERKAEALEGRAA